MKTEWDMTLWYQSDTDLEIECDAEHDRQAVEEFNTRFKGKEMLRVDECGEFLHEYEKICGILDSAKPLRYFSLRESIESGNDAVLSASTRYSEHYTRLSSSLTWTTKVIAGISKKILEENGLENFTYLVDTQKKIVNHVLGDDVEHAIQMLSIPGKELFVQTREKATNKRSISWKGETIPLAVASQKTGGIQDYADRDAFANLIIEETKKDAPLAEAELNSVILTKKITDEMKGFSAPYSQTVLSYQNDDRTVQTLVSAVTESFSIAHRYGRLHAKHLQQDTLRYCDRNVGVGTITREIPFEESYRELQEVFGNFHPRYKELLTYFVEQGQVDVFPRMGKRGGAFCSSGHSVPTSVLLNHDNTPRSHSTFAHEMGHAFHSEESKVQGPLYEAYTISVAEVASTFFEQLAFDAQLKGSTDEEKVVLLDAQINEGIATVFRQVAVFNYELELHTLVREKGMQSHGVMAELMTKHLQSYLGESYALTVDDGYCFVLWPHLRYGFYVHAYAFGYIVSRALFKRYKENPEYRESIMKFLSLGGSMQPEEIFSSIGIDVRSKEFYKEGLSALESDIIELEKYSLV